MGKYEEENKFIGTFGLPPDHPPKTNEVCHTETRGKTIKQRSAIGLFYLVVVVEVVHLGGMYSILEVNGHREALAMANELQKAEVADGDGW